VRESRADTRRALVAALALHALLFALMFAGMWWTRTANPVSAAGPVIEADLVDPRALSAPMRAALDDPATPPPEPVPEPQPEPATPPPQPLPEPVPQEAPVPPQPAPQEMLPEPDTRAQERVEREAEAARRAEREQEERRRQEQVDLTERKRQEEAEKQKRLAEQARQKEIADKLAKIRAEREKAEKDARLAEQKLQQLKDARARAQASEDAAATASPPPGNNGADPDLLARYVAALNAAIVQNWTRPETVPLGQRCKIVIRQAIGGTVVDAKVDPSCPYDALGRRSVEAAVLKADPLPYAGFEPVFNRTLILTFEARDR
jgi:colicin import membrane protein